MPRSQNPPPKPTPPTGPFEWWDLIFLGTHGYVVGVHKFSGHEIWRTSLEGGGYNIVTLLVEDGVLFAATHGYLYALDPASGEVFWRNDLKGLGHHMISLATARGHAPHDQALLQANTQAQQAASTGGAVPGV